MPIIFAILSRLIGIGLFFIGGFVVLSKLFAKPKDQMIKKKSGELDEYLMQNNSKTTPKDIALINARVRFDEEIRASKEKLREQNRRFKRIDGAWRMASIGSGLLAGGLALEVAQNPIGAIGLGILVAALVGWIGAYINNYINDKAIIKTAAVVPPRVAINAPKVIDNGVHNGRTDLINGVLNDAATALNSLDEIIPRLRHTDSVAAVAQIVSVGKRLMNQVADNPEKFATAQRVFTYYCPEAVGVGEALAKMENENKPDMARIISTQSVLQKLSILFERTELELKADDNKSLDIDLKLLDQSLQADLTAI